MAIPSVAPSIDLSMFRRARWYFASVPISSSDQAGSGADDFGMSDATTAAENDDNVHTNTTDATLDSLSSFLLSCA